MTFYALFKDIMKKKSVLRVVPLKGYSRDVFLRYLGQDGTVFTGFFGALLGTAVKNEKVTKLAPGIYLNICQIILASIFRSPKCVFPKCTYKLFRPGQDTS